MPTTSGQPGAKPGPVLVTGANSGLGLAATLALADHGWRTYGTVRSAAKGRRLRRAAEDAGVGGLVRVVVLDVSDHDAVIARWPRLPRFWGVVNNAGASLSGAVEEVSAAEAKALLDINLVTPAVVSSLALPGMRGLGGGRIVMISSLAGRAALLPFHAWYHASKFGLEALSEILRVEVAPFGVKVSVVEPGFVRTEITGKAVAELAARAAAASPYEHGYARARQLTVGIDRLAPGPDAVARAVVSAIESARPKRRYPVGIEASLLPATSLLPASVTDLLMRVVADLGSVGRTLGPPR